MSKESLQRLQSLWMQHRRWLLPALVALMAITAALKLEYGFRRLVWEMGPTGAIDLKHMHRWIASWFAGQSAGQHYLQHYLYPPASYVMLWPLLGWLSVLPARWFWAATSLGAVAATILLIVRITGAEKFWERSFVALLLLSISGTGVAIGNGQLILHILPALLAGVLVLERQRKTLGEDLAAAGLLTWTLIKPTVTAPFFWVLLFGWKRWRPALLVLIMYSLLTLVAAAFQKKSFPSPELFLTKASAAVTFYAGTRNIHAYLIDFGLEKWMTFSSAAIFAALGAWTYRYRQADRWVLVGVAALVARMWAYHRLYDDVLILLPELALFRIAKQSLSPDHGTIAGVLLGLTALAMLCPGWLISGTGQWAWIWTGSHVMLWLLVLAFLVHYARHQRDGSTAVAAR